MNKNVNQQRISQFKWINLFNHIITQEKTLMLH
jgi:hypothetical protein